MKHFNKYIASFLGLFAAAGGFLFLSPVIANAATLVQEAPLLYSGSGNCVSPSTANFSFPSNVTAGDTLVVTVAYKGSSNLVNGTTPTDSQGNTYSDFLGTDTLVSGHGNSNRSIGSFYTTAVGTGSDTVTVTCGANESNTNMVPLVFLHEYSNVSNLLNRGDSSDSSSIPSEYQNGTNTGGIWQQDIMSVNSFSIPTFNTTDFTASSWVNGSLKGSMGGQRRVGQSSESVSGAVTLSGTFQWIETDFAVF